MNVVKKEIICRLQKEILPLEGLKVLPSDMKVDPGFPSLEAAFPNKSLPVGCMHEFLSNSREEGAASYGFISFLLSKFLNRGGNAVWIDPGPVVFPAALVSYGITPENIVFIHLKKQQDIVFTMEEALKCTSLNAVIAVMNHLSFKESRRLQLIAEKSRVTGFILRPYEKIINITACISRWHITSLPGAFESDLPGVSFPHWQIELLKIRNGKPGKWTVEFRHGNIYDTSIKDNAINSGRSAQTG